MSKLPRVSGREVVAVLTRIGFRVRRQHGSHIIMRRDEPFAQTVVPNHPEIDTGTLRAILRQVGIGVAKHPVRHKSLSNRTLKRHGFLCLADLLG